MTGFYSRYNQLSWSFSGEPARASSMTRSFEPLGHSSAKDMTREETLNVVRVRISICETRFAPIGRGLTSVITYDTFSYFCLRPLWTRSKGNFAEQHQTPIAVGPRSYAKHGSFGC